MAGDLTRREFLKRSAGALAAAAVPSVVWPLVSEAPNTVGFTVTGLEAGDRVSYWEIDEESAQLLYDGAIEVGPSNVSFTRVYESDRELLVRVRNHEEIKPLEVISSWT